MSTESREKLKKLLDRDFSIIPVKLGGKTKLMVDYFRHGASAGNLLADTEEEAVEKAIEVLTPKTPVS